MRASDRGGMNNIVGQDECVDMGACTRSAGGRLAPAAKVCSSS